MPVRKRPDRDSWRVDIRIDGRRIREDFPTKRQAIQREREILALAVAGTSVWNAQEIAFPDFCDIYLEHATATKAAKTVYNERWQIRSNLKPFFGRRRLSQLTPALIERYKVHRAGQGVSARTVNLDLQLLSVIFRLAAKLGYARNNPARQVEKLRDVKKPPRYLTREEADRFADAAQTTYLYALVVCALHTGMRKAELFNLRWQDVDFEACAITIGSTDEWQTKNRRYRTVEMTETLREVMVAVKTEARSDEEYCFTYGGRRLGSTVKKTLANISKEAGIERVSLHVLRHTFASHLAMAGVPLMHIQQLLGHSDYSTTLIYAHISQESHKGQVHSLPYGARNPQKES